MEVLSTERFKKGLKIKCYLPLKLKQAFVQEVISNCIEEREGIFYVNYFVKEMVYKLCILRYYTDYQITDKTDYDSLQERGLFEYVINEISKSNKNEISKLEVLLGETIREQKEMYNSLGAIISKKIDEILKVVPSKNEWSKILKNAVKILNKSNPEVVEAFSKELLNGNLLSILSKNKSEKNTQKINIRKGNGLNLSLHVADKD